MQNELEKLEEEVQKLKKKQANCNHEWKETIFDPERREIIEEKDDFQGTPAPDHWYTKKIHTGSYETVKRWSRTCCKCDKKEYTYKQEDIILQSVKKPKF